MSNEEIVKTFFGGATGASALLSGFSFAAALQLIHSQRSGKLAGFTVVLLYTATLLFLFAVVGFNNAAVRPIGSTIDIFRPDTSFFANNRKTFTGEFYSIYFPEFLLATVAGSSFITGVILSAWSFSARMGKSILIAFLTVFLLWSAWFFLPDFRAA